VIALAPPTTVSPPCWGLCGLLRVLFRLDVYLLGPCLSHSSFFPFLVAVVEGVGEGGGEDDEQVVEWLGAEGTAPSFAAAMAAGQ
jgi:hypothetical protein